MRWPIWRQTNANIQRGGPTPAEAYGKTIPTAIGAGGNQVTFYGGGRPGEFAYPQDYATIQRGAPPITPGGMARRVPLWEPAMDPTGSYHVLRHYDWGAAGFGYIGGQVTTNPIGAGIVATNRAGEATKPPGAIGQMFGNAVVFYSLQQQNQGMQPTNSPLVPPDLLLAMAGPVAPPAMLPDRTILMQEAQAAMIAQALYG